jgi:hypothetical protein
MARKYFALKDLTKFVSEARAKLAARTETRQAMIRKLLDEKATKILQHSDAAGWFY